MRDGDSYPTENISVCHELRFNISRNPSCEATPFVPYGLSKEWPLVRGRNQYLK